jgi:hypothetical protein
VARQACFQIKAIFNNPLLQFENQTVFLVYFLVTIVLIISFKGLRGKVFDLWLILNIYMINTNILTLFHSRILYSTCYFQYGVCSITTIKIRGNFNKKMHYKIDINTMIAFVVIWKQNQTISYWVIYKKYETKLHCSIHVLLHQN